MRWLPWVLALLPASARASFLSGDALDAFADVMAWIVVVVVPIALVALFLIVHVLPEKIAEKRHHPQQAAIKTLCFLSLVFGGLLWPLAWLWAFTRPTLFRSVYGTERHENYFVEMGEKARRGELSLTDLEHVRAELREIATRGPLPKALQGVPALIDEAAEKASQGSAPAADAQGAA